MTTTGDSCAFCRIVADDDPAVLVYRGEHVVGFLDIRPVFHGHCLLVPRVHHETLDELPTHLAEPLLIATQLTMRALADAVGAQGTFVASNNVVSQSVPHLHLHVVPRRPKDGLRGFFWPRRPYPDDAALQQMRDRVRTAIDALR
ncbi:MAG: HIT family protein [Actinobacteria bacterium]|nr:HIT family protein [Actinomycetota bacterium]